MNCTVPGKRSRGHFQQVFWDFCNSLRFLIRHTGSWRLTPFGIRSAGSVRLDYDYPELIALLDSIRPRYANDPESQRAFDLLCSDTLTSLRREIEALRFTKAH